MSQLPALVGAVATAALCGWTDWRTGRMPNWITLSSLIAALTVGGAGEGSAGLLRALAGAGAVGAGPAIVFITTRGRGLGGGDVKVLAALGAWLGAARGLEVTLLALLSVLAVALVTDLRQRWQARSCRAARDSSSNEDGSALEWRLGPYVAGATILSVAWTGVGR